MKAIILTRGRIATVDDEDFDRVNQFKWCAKNSDRRPTVFYAHRAVGKFPNRTTQYLHSFLTGYRRTDHRDGDGLNNRRENLRPASSSQNGANRVKRAEASSPFKGVCKDSDRDGWRVQIQVAGKKVKLGTFTSEKAAARAYDTAAHKLFGDFAKLNFPVKCRD